MAAGVRKWDLKPGTLKLYLFFYGMHDVRDDEYNE